jgi:hypothetical protein
MITFLLHKNNKKLVGMGQGIHKGAARMVEMIRLSRHYIPKGFSIMCRSNQQISIKTLRVH